MSTPNVPADDELHKAVNLIALEALVEQYHALTRDLDVTRSKRNSVKGQINFLIRSGCIKLPFHCGAGTIRKAYANEPVGVPKRYALRCRKNGLAHPKRLVVK